MPAKKTVARRAAGLLLKAAAVASVLSGVVLFHWAWTTVGIICGLGLMAAGSMLAPSGRERADPRDGGLYARDGKTFGPYVADPSLPRPSASWVDGF